MLHVKEIHQHCRFWKLMLVSLPNTCWRKCCLGLCGNALEMFVHDIDPHQSGRIFLQLKKRCAASSSLFLQNGHVGSFISTFLLRRFILVDSLPLISLHVKKKALLGTFTFHSTVKAPSWFSSLWSVISILYAFPTVYTPDASSFQIHLSSRSEWMLIPSNSSKNFAAISISSSKSCRLHWKSHSQPVAVKLPIYCMTCCCW